MVFADSLAAAAPATKLGDQCRMEAMLTADVDLA